MGIENKEHLVEKGQVDQQLSGRGQEKIVDENNKSDQSERETLKMSTLEADGIKIDSVDIDPNLDKLGNCGNVANDVPEVAIMKTCLYVKEVFEPCVRGSLLVDSGSNVSLLSRKRWECFTNKPKLVPPRRPFIAANGEEIKVIGRCTLPFQIEHMNFEHEFLVGDIAESYGILGMDFWRYSRPQLKYIRKF
ncbi:hypothetical protein DPMN_085406 [Dreissena polymorpha]|uniref:Uncharacterized protein n=1 Tax=Dreissena polymorpha TaxID=45954 RepID=A0A9D3YGW9_DREPO|nr:hypothetical protein DPMN_085406 [Dreissena polymorpha]